MQGYNKIATLVHFIILINVNVDLIKLMPLNISKLQQIFNSGKMRKADVISSAGISKGTLENVLKGLDPKVSTLQAIANAVGVNICYFFDEEVEERSAGRDYVEKGNIQHHGTEYNGASSTEADLRDQIAQLKSQLEDKDRIIKLMEERK